jgi:signal transduction histidine kinase
MAALDNRRLRVLISGGAEARRALSARLAEEECTVIEVQDRAALLQVLREGEIDLAVVDGQAADRELLALVRRLHAEGVAYPVLMFHDPSIGGQAEEEQFRQARKMETLGRLTAGIVHDFNNLLTVMLSCNELLLLDTPSDDPRLGLVRELGKAADRAAALTRKLLAFGRKQNPEPQVLDLNAIVRDMEPTLRRLLPADIVLEYQLQKGLGPILADPVQIEQMLLNLVLNARDAMPDGGRLKITSDEEGPSGSQVILRVCDTGSGMDPATRDRLFEPFFTTKAAGRGSGLGLLSIQQVVRQCGGRIEVASVPGQGTSFAVFLPAHPAAAPQGAPATLPFIPPQGTETVLLLEDDDVVRQLWQRTLEDLGYHVLPAPDGSRAVALSQDYPLPIDLLIADLDLPALNGWQAAVQIRSERPQLRVLLLTGHAEESRTVRLSLPSGTAILRKPFPPSTLARRLRDLADEPADTLPMNRSGRKV